MAGKSYNINMLHPPEVLQLLHTEQCIPQGQGSAKEVLGDCLTGLDLQVLVEVPFQHLGSNLFIASCSLHEDLSDGSNLEDTLHLRNQITEYQGLSDFKT